MVLQIEFGWVSGKAGQNKLTLWDRSVRSSKVYVVIVGWCMGHGGASKSIEGAGTAVGSNVVDRDREGVCVLGFPYGGEPIKMLQLE